MYVPLSILLFLFAFAVFVCGIFLSVFLRKRQRRQKNKHSLEKTMARLSRQRYAHPVVIKTSKTPNVKQEEKINAVEAKAKKGEGEEDEDGEDDDEEYNEEKEKNLYHVLAHELKSEDYRDWDLYLTRFYGIHPSDYKPEDVDAFREILYRLQEKDIAGWLANLLAKGIALPNDLKDEAYFLARNWRFS